MSKPKVFWKMLYKNRVTDFFPYDLQLDKQSIMSYVISPKRVYWTPNLCAYKCGLLETRSLQMLPSYVEIVMVDPNQIWFLSLEKEGKLNINAQGGRYPWRQRHMRQPWEGRGSDCVTLAPAKQRLGLPGDGKEKKNPSPEA